MNQLNCEFQNPVNLGTEENPDWEFSSSNCEYIEEGITTITDGDYIAYISSKINLAEVFIIGFLIILLGALIFKFIWDFFHFKIVKEKTNLDL